MISPILIPYKTAILTNLMLNASHHAELRNRKGQMGFALDENDSVVIMRQNINFRELL